MNPHGHTVENTTVQEDSEELVQGKWRRVGPATTTTPSKPRPGPGSPPSPASLVFLHDCSAPM